MISINCISDPILASN